MRRRYALENLGPAAPSVIAEVLEKIRTRKTTSADIDVAARLLTDNKVAPIDETDQGGTGGVQPEALVHLSGELLGLLGERVRNGNPRGADLDAALRMIKLAGVLPR